jgi:prepilin peptidase CpaA
MMDAGRTATFVCFAIVALAAVWDSISRRIPNTLTVGGLALGFAIHAALGYTEAGRSGAFRGLGWSFLGMGACAALPALSFARGEMGGGDVKLFAAIGALCGPVLGYSAEAWTYGFLLVAIYPLRMIRHGVLVATVKNTATAVANAFRPKDRQVAWEPIKLASIPLGPAIFAGTCIAFTLHGAFR